LFGKRKDDEPDMVGKEISVVMSVEHTGHAGFDAQKGSFDTRNLPEQLQVLFDAVESSLQARWAPRRSQPTRPRTF
jgi:hypothetical protein